MNHAACSGSGSGTRILPAHPPADDRSDHAGKRADGDRTEWLDERRAFLDAITILELPVETLIEKQQVILRPADPATPFFCSWPDAFGPCQFEYNTTDSFEFLVPASKLAATFAQEPAGVRAYLTGFSEEALTDFAAIEPGARFAYRCSVHCPLDELPEVLRQSSRRDAYIPRSVSSKQVVPEGDDASAIIGIVGLNRTISRSRPG
jgi:hypothetical protein